jgi:hypothetical protein
MKYVTSTANKRKIGTGPVAPSAAEPNRRVPAGGHPCRSRPGADAWPPWPPQSYSFLSAPTSEIRRFSSRSWSVRQSPRRLMRHLSRVGSATAVTLAFAGLGAGCARIGAAGPVCAARMETLPASAVSSLIAVVPRTSASAAIWGLDELAQLLPSVARAGLELHVLYTQDADDLAEGGGDGGPPQVVITEAPGFAVFRVGRAPQAPPDPTPLTGKMYCDRVAAWHGHSDEELQAEAARRTAVLKSWARTTAARLEALADKPIPDTSGSEGGVEADAGASIFTAAQIAQAAPRPTILFLGGLTELTPPAQSFRFPARLVALIRSSNPGEVIHAEAAWARWADRAGGRFEALSANDTQATIAGVLVRGPVERR